MSADRESFKVTGRTEPGRETRLPIASSRYRAPNKDEIKAVTRMLGLNVAAAGQLLGVHSGTVRKWIVGETEIPYSAWRLLLIHAGLALEDPGKQELEDINEAALRDLVADRDD